MKLDIDDFGLCIIPYKSLHLNIYMWTGCIGAVRRTHTFLYLYFDYWLRNFSVFKAVLSIGWQILPTLMRGSKI